MPSLPRASHVRLLATAAVLVVSMRLARAQDDFGGLPPDELPPAPAAAPAPAPAPAVAPAPTPAADQPAAAPAPTPAAAPTTTVEAPAAPIEVGTADESFGLRTRQLEEQVTDLKEKVHRAKRRLIELQEQVMGFGINSGAKLVLAHRNELGSSYVLTSFVATLDGAPAYTKVNDETGELNESEGFPFWEQRVVPGQHIMAVQYKLRGHGYGIFAYLEGMQVNIRSSYTFTAEPDRISTVTSVLYEKSGVTLEFKDKPDIKFEVDVKKDLKAQEPKPEPQASAAGVGQ